MGFIIHALQADEGAQQHQGSLQGKHTLGQCLCVTGLLGAQQINVQSG